MKYEDNPIVGYLHNDKAVPIDLYGYVESNNLFNRKYFRPIRLFDPIGRRIYRHSLTFLFCYACSLAVPYRQIRVEHSLGDGLFFNFSDGMPISEDEILKIRSTMKDLVSRALPISYKMMSYPDVVEVMKRQGMESTARLIECGNMSEVGTYRIEDYYDVAYEPIVNNSSVLSMYEIMPYTSSGILLRYPVSKNIMEIGEFSDNPALFKVFRESRKWAGLLGVLSVADLNKVVFEEKTATYIRQSEALARMKLFTIAQDIVEHGKSSVFVAGPSSSGKTTFSIKLSELLTLMGCRVIQISLDNYYKPRVDIPRDERGQIDYECLDALRLDLFHSDMRSFYNGEEVALPIWDFEKQERRSSKPVSLDNKTVFVIEGIHALNPELNGVVPPESIYRIYVSALTQLNLDDHNRISTTDNRILRRILRDNRTRGFAAVRTLEMWESVERGEQRWIFPYQNLTDVNYNSASDYELSVLKPLVTPLLKAIKPCTGVSYSMARRLLDFIENFYPIDSSLVPTDAILREFIGGSDYGAV